MKKRLISIVIFLLLIFAYFATAITMSDYDKVYRDFLTRSSISEASLEGVEYELRKFPEPMLVIKQVIDPGKVELSGIRVKFSLMSILTFAPQVTELSVDKARMHLENDEVRLISHDDFISELIAREDLALELKVKEFELVESDEETALIIDNFYFNGLGRDTKFSGMVDNVGNLNGMFKREEDKKVEFSLDVTGSGFTANISEQYESGMLKSGVVQMKSKNLVSRLGKLIPDINQISTSLASDEEVTVTLDIEPVHHWMNFKSIKISSPSIDGTGEISLSKEGADKDKIKIHFSKIDLSSWVKKSDENVPEPVGFASGSKFDFNKNKFDASISAEKIIMGEKNSMSDVSLKAHIENNKFIIKEFGGKINQDGSFRVSGSATQNDFRSLFEGKILLEHQDLNDLLVHMGDESWRSKEELPFVMNADIKLNSVDVSLRNILIKMNGNEIRGGASVKYIGNTPRINTDLKVKDANIDENSLPIVKAIYDYSMGLIHNSKEETYLNRFIPLRKITSMSTYSVSFDKVTSGGEEYSNVSLNLQLSPGRANISNLYIAKGDDFIDFSADLHAQGVKPVLNVRIKDGSLPVTFLGANQALELRKKIMEDYDLSKFDLRVNAYMTKLYQGDFTLGRMFFTANIGEKLFDIKKFDADIFGGRWQSSGSILLDPFTFNFVYALNSAQVTLIREAVPEGYINTDGAISLRGMWTTNGATTKEMLYNFYTKSTIITKNIEIGNFSIDEFLRKISTKGYNDENLKQDKKQALLTGSTKITDLQMEAELTKGELDLRDIKFKTAFTSGIAAAKFNIYDFNVNINSEFSFLVAANIKPGVSFVNYQKAKMKMQAAGNLYSPKKEADFSDIDRIIKERKEGN